MEHQADVHPQLRLILPDAGPGCEKNGRRATWAVTTRSGRHQVPVAVLPTAKSLSASLKPQSDRLLGYGLTTAEIVYRRPDRHWLLQTYIWQDYDMFPNFPALKDFLAFWEKSLEGPLFAVTVAHSKLIKPAELHAVDGVFRLH